MFDEPEHNPKDIKWTDLCYAGYIKAADQTPETKLNPPCKPKEAFVSVLMLFPDIPLR